MSRVFESKKVYVTMFVLFAMSVAVNSLAGGSFNFGSSPVLAPAAQHILVADSPFGGPDPFERDGRA
jgi:hypothetical protein